MYSSPQEIWIRIRFLEINRSPSQEPFPDPCFGNFSNECVHTQTRHIYHYKENQKRRTWKQSSGICSTSTYPCEIKLYLILNTFWMLFFLTHIFFLQTTASIYNILIYNSFDTQCSRQIIEMYFYKNCFYKTDDITYKIYF